MADENQNQEKTFTQAYIDNLNAEHQKAMDALAKVGCNLLHQIML